MKRRSGAEVNALLIKAAHQLFTEKGYKATSTREIARLAQIAEPIIFRRYNTKVQLFVSTVVEPVLENVEAFNREWRNTPNCKEISTCYLHSLHQLLKDNCRSLLAITTAIVYESEEAKSAGIEDVTNQIVSTLTQLTRSKVICDEGHKRDLLARIIVSSIWSASVNGDYFVSQRKKDSFIHYLIEMMVTQL